MFFVKQKRYVTLFVYLCISYSHVVSQCFFIVVFFAGAIPWGSHHWNQIKDVRHKNILATQKYKPEIFHFFPKKILRSSPSNNSLQNVDDSLLVLQWYAPKGSLPRTRQAPVIPMSQFRWSIVTITININLCLTL